MTFRRAGGCLALTVALVCAASAQSGVQADKQFQAALHKENVDGDLKAAIEEYRKISTRPGVGRELAATSLVRMAECYRKLGDAQAREIYAQVVREFADQPIAGEARTQLAAMGVGRVVDGAKTVARATGDRVVWAGLGVFSDGRVSPDGRFVSNTDWATNFSYNLALRDLVTGTDRQLTSDEDQGGNAWSSTFSPDGKQLAYGWRTYGEPHVDELRVVNVEGTGIPQPRRVFGTEDINSIYPSDWSPDGKWLAVHVVRRDRNGQIALIAVQDGAFRPLKSVGWRGPTKIFFSPDGKYLAYDLPAGDTESQRDVFVIAVDGSRETPAVAHPAHDVVMGWSPDGKQLLFASDRTGAVGLWAVPVIDGKSNAAPTLLKPDIGSVSSLGLTASGALHVVREASTESIQIAALDLASGKLSGPPVLENFRSRRPDWSRDGKFLAYQSTAPSGIRVLTIRSVESGDVRVLRPALEYFNELRWLPDARSLMTFGRDLKGRGGIYQIDALTGAVSFVTESPINRVQVSPDGKKIYHNIAQSGFVERDLASGTVREVLPRFASRGNPELSPDGRSLAVIVTDARAKTSAVMLAEVAGGEPRELLRVSLPDRCAPFANMSWTPDSQGVVVVKGNGDFEAPKPGDRLELWLVPLSGTARKLDIDLDGWNVFGGIRLHPNGRQIAFFTGKSSREVWALENVVPRPNAGR